MYTHAHRRIDSSPANEMQSLLGKDVVTPSMYNNRFI